jgi:RNA polymerase sigma factor (TIGR02999 family)
MREIEQRIGTDLHEMATNNTRALSRKDVTILLKAWNDGDPLAPDKLAPLIYAELRKLARRSMRRESAQHTLETGALINEAYLRLADWKNARWENRAHFYGVAAQIMRRVLVDHARAHAYQKRGGGARPLSLEEAIVAAPDRAPALLALDEALDRLAKRDPRKASVVELRFFGGLSVEETAAVLNVSPFTVIRDWNFVKAWLSREIKATNL